MHIEFTPARDRTYARQLFAVTMLRSRIFTGLLGVVLISAGALAYQPDRIGAAAGSGVLLGLGICWVIKPFIMARQLVARLPPTWYADRTYRLTDDELGWQSARARTALSWDLVARARTYPFGFVLWQAGGLASWDIPRAGLTDGQADELTRFLIDRGLLPGGAGGDPTPARVTADGRPAEGQS
ncbi:YcxB family protein [Plantactinospora sp. KLBMP9567]|uniref:YcxB family protein n=1 Tax=Plantactinospora sp. KLBMP9567 TaxID=3085900 RepID=UPI002980F07D|nr:YcxB family protein [Plantactinospora sp. KLBMP9567]MDW5323992.1 YcxB family protein [Plantactinospora sp. KLBMP9567]